MRVYARTGCLDDDGGGPKQKNALLRGSYDEDAGDPDGQRGLKSQAKTSLSLHCGRILITNTTKSPLCL